MNAHEFYLDVNGKKIDIDGYYGAQCWDLFAYFCDKYIGKHFNCYTTGYVRDLWNDRKTNGILEHFEEVTHPYDLKDGDWVILDGVSYPYSHVAMFRRYNDERKTSWILLGQNQTSTQEAMQKYLPVADFLGAFRLKETVKGIPSKGKATVIVDILNVRNSPDLVNPRVTYYEKGMIFYYDSIKEVNGYVWGHYISYSGNDRYVALCDSSGTRYVTIE